MVAIGQGIETELVSTAAEPLVKGGDRIKSQKDRVDKHEREGQNRRGYFACGCAAPIVPTKVV